MGQKPTEFSTRATPPLGGATHDGGEVHHREEQGRERDVVAAHGDHEDVAGFQVVAEEGVLREKAIERSVVEGRRLQRRVVPRGVYSHHHN